MRNQLINKIQELLTNKKEGPIFAVIDGPAGAGKTTLANEIISACEIGEVIHCDDLYNGWEDALTSTFEKNLEEWILTPLRTKRFPRYQKFDWVTGVYASTINVPESPLLILEGVGAAIASVTDVADLSIWIDIPAEIGLHRVLARDGEEIRDQMKRWLKVQEEFFAQHNNRENCAYQLPFGEPHQK